MSKNTETSSTDLRTEMLELRSSLFSNGEGEVWLYGSRARGDFKADSDWDILVIVNEEMSFRDAYDKYAHPFVELGWEYNQSIIPVVYTRLQWDRERNSLFYNNVIDDRIRI